MSLLLALLGYGLLVGAAAPRWLRAQTWPQRAPAWGMLAWLAVSASALLGVLALASAPLWLLAAHAGVGAGARGLAHWCHSAIAAVLGRGDGGLGLGDGLGAAAVAVAAIAAVAPVVAVTVRVVREVVRVRRRAVGHASLARLVGEPGPAPGSVLLP